MKLSPALQRRGAIAVAVFVSAFLTTYLGAKGGITLDVLSGAVSAGVAAVSHYLVNLLAPVVELDAAHEAIQAAATPGPVTVTFSGPATAPVPSPTSTTAPAAPPAS